jgi:P-type E1-E2 ATPase
VTNSLAALAHSLVYCTEPYRISYAGRLDTICFDKTGTLTKDEMIFKGVVAPQDVAVFSQCTTTNNNNNAATAGNEESSSMMLEELSYAHEDIMVVDEGSPDIVLAMMGCCHDLMVPSQSDANGAMSNLVGKYNLSSR